jgi:hypothetical protein
MQTLKQRKYIVDTMIYISWFSLLRITPSFRRSTVNTGYLSQTVAFDHFHDNLINGLSRAGSRHPYNVAPRGIQEPPTY